jgi:hypothetical protein
MASSLDMSGAMSKAMRQDVRRFFYSIVKIYLTDFGQPETDAGYFEVLVKLLGKIGYASLATLREFRIDIKSDKTADQGFTASRASQALFHCSPDVTASKHSTSSLRCHTSSVLTLMYCTRISGTTSY